MRKKQKNAIGKHPLILFLFMFFFILMNSSSAYAVGVEIIGQDGKPLEGNPPDFQKYAHANIDSINEFELKEEFTKEFYVDNFMKIDPIIAGYNECKDANCKKVYESMFYQLQSTMYNRYGIGLEVPKGGIGEWKAKHFWVYTDHEGAFFQGGSNNMYTLAKNDSMKLVGELYKNTPDKDGDKCKIRIDCYVIAKKQIENDLKKSYESHEQKLKLENENKELAEKVASLDEKIKIAERVKGQLTDDTASNDQAALDDYCTYGIGSTNVCGLRRKAQEATDPAQKEQLMKQAINAAKAEIDAQLQELTNQKKKADEEKKKTEAELSKVESDIDKTENSNPVGNYQEPTGKSPWLPSPNANGSGKVIIAYEGLFTQSLLLERDCKEDVIGGGEFAQGTVNGDPTEGKIAKIFVDIISGVVKSVVDVLFEMQCPGVDNGNFSLLSEVLNISTPLNLTQNFIIMKLVSITQSLAYIVAFAMIVFYGVMYTMGYENMDPVKFTIRMFFAMILVYYLPYLMQDILNINNVIVHYLSQIKVTFQGNDTVSVVFAGAIQQWITSITESFLTNLLTLILAIAMIILAIQPIVKIFVWWYGRMIKIFFYAIIGPIMVVMMALPQTSDKANKWMKDFIGETFSQVFMVLAMAMLSFIVGNMQDFQILTNIGWLGSLLVMYASVIFLSEVPEIAKAFFGGISGMSGLGSQVSRATNQTKRGAKNAVAGAKNMGSNMANAAKNVTNAATTGQKGASMASIKNAKGFSGKMGALAGATAGKAYTARDSKNVIGNLMNKGAKKLSKDSNTNFAPFQTSAHQKVNAKIKPSLEQFKAEGNNKRAEKAQNYQQHSNDVLKQAGGDLTNMQTAQMQADTEARRGVAQLLGKDGSVEGQRELHDVATKNGGANDPQNNVIPVVGGKPGAKQAKSGATQTQTQSSSNVAKPGTAPGNVPIPGGGSIPSGGGGSAQSQSATSTTASGGTAADAAKAAKEAKENIFSANPYVTEPMTKAEFKDYNTKQRMSESDFLKPGQVKLNDLKRQESQAKHDAAFFGPHGAGHKNNQPSYGDMVQKMNDNQIKRTGEDGKSSIMDKTQSLENYLTRIGVSEGSAKNAASKLQTESQGGQSQIATAINRAMGEEGSKEVKTQKIKEALQQADVKGNTVAEVSEKIYQHESYLRESGKVSGKDNGDVVIPQTSSPKQTNGELKQTAVSQVETVTASAQKATVEPSAQKQSIVIDDVIQGTGTHTAKAGETSIPVTTEVINEPTQSTSYREKTEPVIIEEIVGGTDHNYTSKGNTSSPVPTENVERSYNTEIINEPTQSTSSREKTEPVIIERTFEDTVEQVAEQQTTSSVMAQEDLIQGTDYTYRSQGDLSTPVMEDQANKQSNIDRTTKTEYEQPGENDSYDEYKMEMTNEPQRKQELQRQQKLWDKAMGRYQDMEDITPERIEREMRVSKKDARRIANRLGQRPKKRDDS